MYNSKYYTCEQVDQRLLQGYYDDAVAAGYTGSKAQYLAGLLKAINYSANPTLTADNVVYDPAISGLTSKNVKVALDELADEFKQVVFLGDPDEDQKPLPQPEDITRANLATKAIQDDDGNSIKETYATNENLGITKYPHFSVTNKYSKGTTVYLDYDRKLYQFTVDHEPGDWNPSHVVQIDYITDHIVQEPGNSTDKVMSQKAVSDKFNELLKNIKFEIGSTRLEHTFNVAQEVGVVVPFNGMLSSLKVNVGEAVNDVQINIYKDVNSSDIISSKSINLLEGENTITDLNLRVNAGNVVYIERKAKIKYGLIASGSPVFYSKQTKGFYLRKDVLFQLSVEIVTDLENIISDIGKKVDKTDIVQEPGNSTDKVMSQKAVSDKFNELLKNIKFNYVTVQSTAFNSIRDTLNKITDASELNRYIVIVPSGTYNECDIQGKKYVTIKGENRNSVIIKADGTSDNITPEDYFWEDYKNTALKNIPRSFKHIICLKEDLEIENCTFIANECKYVFHGENSGWTNCKFTNCVLKETNCDSTIGLGLRHVQHLVFKNCEIYSDSLSGILYYHNWTWKQTTNFKIPLYGGGSKCSFEGCKLNIKRNLFISFDELASRNDDICLFENCSLESEETIQPTINFSVGTNNNVSIAVDLENNHYSNLEEVPYCMRLIAIKSNFDKCTFTNSNRKNYNNYVFLV